MEKTKKQNKETKIGKIIYGFLLFLPLFAIGVTCGYAIFNKNAFQSYSDYKINETIQVHNASEFIEGQIYQFTYNENNSFDTDWTYYNINYISLTANNLNLTELQYDSIYKYNIVAPNIIQFREQSGTLIKALTLNYNDIYTFEIQGGISPQLYNKGILTYQRLVSGTIDNVFYYSIDKVQESPLFNWTTNTQIYTIVNNFTYLLGITNTFIPLLMTYWLLITVAYLIYDLGLMMLLICHRKIHDLGDNI